MSLRTLDNGVAKGLESDKASKLQQNMRLE